MLTDDPPLLHFGFKLACFSSFGQSGYAQAFHKLGENFCPAEFRISVLKI